MPTRPELPEYRPLLLWPAQAADRARLAALRETTPGIEVHDRYLEQLGSLLKCRQPGRSFAAAGLEQAVTDALQGRAAEDCGVWVYYPWSRRLVHLLDEEEFQELRTNRNRYKILPDEQQALRGRRVGVVGLSVGQAVALAMALERSFGQIRLADFDTLDLSNLNRIRSGLHNLGLPLAQGGVWWMP